MLNFWRGFRAFLIPSIAIVAGITLIPAVFASDGTLPLTDWLASIFSANWKGLSAWGVVGLVIKLLVDATKTELLGGLFKKLPDAAQVLLILGLSTLSVGVGVLATGGSWGQGVSAIVQSSAAAMFINEVLKRVLGLGQKSA